MKKLLLALSCFVALNSAFASQLLVSHGKPTDDRGVADDYCLDPVARIIYYKSGATWDAGTSFANFQAVLGFTAENSANKVTAFSSPTDVQYPSAKLVNDQLA